MDHADQFCKALVATFRWAIQEQLVQGFVRQKKHQQESELEFLHRRDLGVVFFFNFKVLKI